MSHYLIMAQKSIGFTAVHGGRRRSQNSELPVLKLGVLLVPHESAEDIEPTVQSYALEVIDGKKQGKIHVNADLQELGDKLLLRAMEYLHQNSESKMYQMSLKSRHGTAHVCVEKATTEIQTAGGHGGRPADEILFNPENIASMSSVRGVTKARD